MRDEVVGWRVTFAVVTIVAMLILAVNQGSADPIPRSGGSRTQVGATGAGEKAKLGLTPPVREVDRPALENTSTGWLYFYQRCKSMDNLMNVQGIEQLARLRTKLVPNHCGAYGVLGYALQWQGRKEAAAEAYEKASQLFEEDRAFRALLQIDPMKHALIQRAMRGDLGLYFFAGNEVEAQVIATRITVRNHPSDPQAWMVLGVLAATREDMALLAICADNLERLDPERALDFKANVVEPTKAQVLMRLRAAGLNNN